MLILERRKPAFTLLFGLLLLASTIPVAAEEKLPAADDLFAKHIAAVGGEKSIRATQSMRAKGKMEMPAMGMSADLDVAAKAPNKVLMTIDMQSVGVILSGYDGEVAWSDNPMTGAMILEGDLAAQTIKQADFYSELNYEKKYPTRETVAKAEFAGESAYKVRLVDTEGTESFEYFSVDSGLLIGQEGEQITEMGNMFVTTELSDYREVAGRKVPMSSVAKMAGMEMKMTFEEVQFDGVDDSTFALPLAIQTLIEAKTKSPESKDG